MTITECDGRIVQLHWRAADDNNSPITNYLIQYNTSFDPDTWHTYAAKTVQAAHQNRTFQRITLSPWGNYSFRVIAKNVVGFSRPSVPSIEQCFLPAEVPHLNPRGVCTRNTQPRELFITWDVRCQNYFY